jgi:hypothetical protein
MGGGSPLVVEESTQTIVPSYVRMVERKMPTVYSITNEDGDGALLHDGNLSTSVRYELPESRLGLATLLIVSKQPMVISGLTFSFEKNARKPTTIEIRSRDESGQESIMLSHTEFTSDTVSFVSTRTVSLVVYLEYEQPLALTEVEVKEESVPVVYTRNARFLAQPGATYTIYDQPDRYVSIPYQEQGNLRSDEGVVMPLYLEGVNTRYMPVDTDADGVSDPMDNCPSFPNGAQMDTDGDRIGDECEDYDRDSIIEGYDNCPTEVNSNQQDTDGDGIGDVCDVAENRFTERLPWVPWVGMGVAAMVLLGLFISVLKEPKKSEERSEEQNVLGS